MCLEQEQHQFDVLKRTRMWLARHAHFPMFLGAARVKPRRQPGWTALIARRRIADVRDRHVWRDNVLEPVDIDVVGRQKYAHQTSRVRRGCWQKHLLEARSRARRTCVAIVSGLCQ